MRWTLSGVALAALVMTQPVSAQPGPGPGRGPAPGGSDEVRRLEAQLDKLRAEMREVEARLQKVRSASPREGDRKEPGRPMSWEGDRKDAGRPTSPPPREADRRPEGDRRPEPRPEAGHPAGPPFGRGPGGFGPPPFVRGPMGGPTPPARTEGNRPGPGPDRMAEIEKRLDQLTKAVEELRQQARRGR